MPTSAGNGLGERNVDVITILLIAVGLAMDAFAVSIVAGSVHKKLKINHALLMAFFFGTFQAIMPMVGSQAALAFKSLIADYDHWVAFVLLTVIGAKMVFESFQINTASKRVNHFEITTLLILSLATSVDALVVGITLPLVTSYVTLAVTIIGLVTFILCCAGAFIGKKLGHFFESKIEAMGGIILIALGVKILLSHLFF